MRLAIAPRFDEIDQVSLARSKSKVGQAPAKQFVPQEHPICVDHVAFAVFGNLADVAVAVIFLDLSTADPARLARQTHDAAEQRRLTLETE
jgi:hypothetical protein